MLTGDTIVAISSATGPAARMLVRFSGPDAHGLLKSISDPSDGSPGAARFTLRFADVEVPAWVYRFHAPHSVTGEDVVEFHIPGSPLLARMLVDELTRHGARHAEPGEFTARAYFSGKLDLSEAEGVAATIGAHSRRELDAARKLLAGELSRRLRPILDEIAQTLALIEVGIDFTEEDVTFLSDELTRQRLASVDAALKRLLDESARFERLSHEPRIVLVGRPNAGKSTLLNALAGHARAVVSPEAGTTRDVIWSSVMLRRGTALLIDVAGIEPEPVDEDISRQMQQRARQAIEEADLVVLVQDIMDARPPLILDRPFDLTVLSKSDTAATDGSDHRGAISASAHTGANIASLRERLDVLAFGGGVDASATLALTTRHIRAIDDARGALTRALEHVSTRTGPEVVAIELREALDALGSILGTVTPDELLGRIFSAFCIGK